MKKLHIAILIIIVLIAICAIITIPKIIENYNKNNEILITSEYSEKNQIIVDNGNTIMYTVFYSKGENPVKLETIYTFKDGVVSSLKMIVYCETINWAKAMEHTKYDNESDFIRSRDKNVITYDFKVFEKRTKEEVIENFKKDNKNLVIISEN